MFVAADRRVWFLRERVEGMLHFRHQILEESIRNITDEEIMLRVAIGKELVERIRDIRNRAI